MVEHAKGDRPDRAARAHALIAAVPAVTAALALVGVIAMRQSDAREQAGARRQQANEFTAAFAQVMEGELTSLAALSGLFAASRSVEPDQFAIFHQHLRHYLVPSTSLHWVPMLRPGELDDHVARTRDNGVSGYRVWSADPSPTASTADQPHWPVTYSAPSRRGEHLAGRDLAVDLPALVARAQQSAIDHSRFVVPAPSWWVRGGDCCDLLVGQLVFRSGAPVATAEQRRAALLGCLLIAVDLTGMVDKTTSVIPTAATSGARPARPLAILTGEEPDPARHSSPHDLKCDMRVAGHPLQLLFAPVDAAAAPWSMRSWSILLGGFIATLLVLGCALAVNRNRLRVELLVQLRTRELEENSALMAAIVENAADAILTTDGSGRIIACNSAGARMFGLDLGLIGGCSLAELVVPEHAETVRQLFAQAPDRNGRRSAKVEARWPDGSILPMELVLGEWTGDSHLTTVMGRDLSRERLEREHEEQQRQAQKLEAVGQLAAGIAHEINSPIQYVSDNVSFLQGAFRDMDSVLSALVPVLEDLQAAAHSSPRLPELLRARDQAELDYLLREIPTALEQSREGLARVAEIVRAMKEFSHPSEEMAPADINRLIRCTTTVARNEWKYVADLQCDLDPDLPLVPCRQGEINQVILNMVVNAAHAIADVVGDGSAGKGTIRIQTSREPEHVCIRISDTGCGIPKENLDRIFLPFFTTKPVGKGTGQGLAIAYNVIATKHGGSIAVESDVGVGTSFIIRLPIAGASQAALALAEAAAS